MVKSWPLLVAGVCVAIATPARGDDDPTALQHRGEQLAKEGQFAEAIDVFKAADAIRPTTEHACLIGLAYGRRNLYGQAELFFDLCHERAVDGDPVPSWVAKVERQFRERLDQAKLAPIKIVVKHGANARIVVSAFAADEAFSARTIHLSPGRHTITVTVPARGGDRERAPIERAIVVEGSDPQKVVIDARAPTEEPATEGSSGGHLGRNVAIVGVGILVAGAVVHGTWYRSELNELEAAQNPPDVARYDAHVDAYRTSRYVTVGLYGAGAVTAIIGLVLHATRGHEASPAVSIVPTDGGGVFAVEWSR